jgi:biopolymer transport protein TolQ
MEASMFTKFILLVLAFMSVMSWAIMINKYLFLNGYRSRIAQFVKSLTSQGTLEYIEDTCSHFSTGSARTMPVLLLKLVSAKKEGKLRVPPGPIIENAAAHESHKLMKNMGALATAANVSPLIGLLGTVWGIMYSFMNIGQEGTASIAVVAPGIAEALMTTIAGLCVAIPAMAGHNYLTGWINTCLDSIDLVTEYAVSILK